MSSTKTRFQNRNHEISMENLEDLNNKDFLEISIENIKLDQDPGKDYDVLLQEKSEETVNFAIEVSLKTIKLEYFSNKIYQGF